MGPQQQWELNIVDAHGLMIWQQGISSNNGDQHIDSIHAISSCSMFFNRLLLKHVNIRKIRSHTDQSVIVFISIQFEMLTILNITISMYYIEQCVISIHSS